LNAVSSQSNPVYPAGGSLADVFKAFLNQKAHTLFTRAAPPGSEGYGNPIGNIRNGTASIYSAPATGNQTLFDADATISELFHLAGQNKWYSDKELAIALSKSSYAGLAASFISPERNIFDPSYVSRAGETERNQVAYSNYFHTIQSNVCHVLPGTHELR